MPDDPIAQSKIVILEDVKSMTSSGKTFAPLDVIAYLPAIETLS